MAAEGGRVGPGEAGQGETHERGTEHISTCQPAERSLVADLLTGTLL